MIKLTAKELTHMLMALTIMATGLMINSTDSAWSHGLMVLSTKDNTRTAKKTERES
jgi:hypothetical protein